MLDVGCRRVGVLEMAYERQQHNHDGQSVFSRFAPDAFFKARIRLHCMKRDADNSAYEYVRLE